MHSYRASKVLPSLHFDTCEDDEAGLTNAAAYKDHFEKRYSELKKSMARNGRLTQTTGGFPGSFLKLFASAFSIMLTAFDDGSEGQKLWEAGMNVGVKIQEKHIL